MTGDAAKAMSDSRSAIRASEQFDKPSQERHWDIGMIATPQGLGFLNMEAFDAQAGRPIRSV
ncbi:hypothetical protein [Streptomyces sp. NBC_01637]|uniref:hypothetical protein n=1 Tax=unclassified Streptomyces TaxID=2593676 RepID=UPI003867A8AC